MLAYTVETGSSSVIVTNSTSETQNANSSPISDVTLTLNGQTNPFEFRGLSPSNYFYLDIAFPAADVAGAVFTKEYCDCFLLSWLQAC